MADAPDGNGDRIYRASRRFTWLVVALGVWLVGGTFLVSRALNQGLTTDIGFSPYHVPAYAGLLAALALVIAMVLVGRRQGRDWRHAFPDGYAGLWVGVVLAIVYVIGDAMWREAAGIEPGIESGLAPTRLLIPLGLGLIASGPLVAALRSRDARIGVIPALISTALLLAILATPGGLHPVLSPWLERAPDTAADNSEIWSMHPDGSAQTRLIEAEENVEVSAPAWSPDGAQFAYTRWLVLDDGSLDADVWLASADGSNRRVLVSREGWQWIPHWSVDGRTIGYTDDPERGQRSEGAAAPRAGVAPDDPGFVALPAPLTAATSGPGADLWVIAADGSGNPTRLTDTVGFDRAGSWSADGRRVAFDATRDGNTEIYVMNADGSNPLRLTNDPGEDWGAAWSPDGKTIAFNSDRSGSFEIYVVAPDGAGLTQVTHDGTVDRGPAWSPDGRRISFAVWAGDDTEIWSVAPDGSDARNLSRSPGTADGDWDGGDWNQAGGILFTRWSYGPATASGLVRQDLAVLEILLQAILLAGVALLLVRLAAPFGSFALILGLATVLLAFQTDGWRFVPGAVVAGLLVDILVSRAPRRSRPLIAAVASAVAFVAAVGVTVSLSGGLAWSPTLLLGVIATSGLLAGGLSVITRSESPG